jgi:hypothetical protein
VWDAMSGGNQIQSVTLEQSGGAPTNRIASVTNNGVTVNYAYDAAGNVTNDGVHSYKYDAENRLVKVDGGATAEYLYDHQNRRVRKIVGSAWTHYVWEGSQVISEHDGITVRGFGPGEPPYGLKSVRMEYFYAGSRMLSRKEWSSPTQWTLLPFTPLSAPLGFVHPPIGLLGWIAAMVVAYLAAAEVAKRQLYRRYLP